MLPIQTVSALVLGTVLGFESWGYMMPHMNPMGPYILVNKQYKAPTIPLALYLPDVEAVEERYKVNTYMTKDAVTALEEMFRAAKEEGIQLYSLSGFRSYSTQKAIFDRKRQERGERVANKSSAKAGYSEHQTGLAMDFEGQSMLGRGLVAEIGESVEGIWVAENCWRFGFILRYPKDKTDITGYIYEPWHVRYVGKKIAEEIHELGDITFEEYIPSVRTDRVRQMEGIAP